MIVPAIAAMTIAIATTMIANSLQQDMFYDKRHSPEAQEWYFRLMNDPNYFEKWRYIDTISDYNSIIEEFVKLYQQTPITDRYASARILNGMKQV